MQIDRLDLYKFPFWSRVVTDGAAHQQKVFVKLFATPKKRNQTKIHPNFGSSETI